MGKELSAAKDSNADLTLKLATLTETLDSAKKREVDLEKDIKANEALLARAAETQNLLRELALQLAVGKGVLLALA